MKILLTNWQLKHRAGTEVVVRDLAVSLLKRGHTPICYSPHLGEIAREIRDFSVPVIDDLHRLSVAPDVIHGHHHLTTMQALLHFHRAPGLFVCHGWMPWHESPPLHPRLLRYVAVSAAGLDRLQCESGVPPERTRVLPNAVDLQRFSRRPLLPPQPRRALVFSNYIEQGPFLQAVRAACARANIELHLAGLKVQRVSARPETLLPAYDLVFAVGRSALEALVVGCAVVVCAPEGIGPMVTTRNFDALRRLNFGMRTPAEPVGVNALARAIACYDADDAAQVCQRARANAGLQSATDAYLALYEEVVAEFAACQNRALSESCASSEGRAVAAYLKGLEPRLHLHPPLHQPRVRPSLWKRAHGKWRHWRTKA